MKALQFMPLVGALMIFIGSCTRNAENDVIATSKTTSWRFAVVGDTHVATGSDTIAEMIPFLIQDSIRLMVVCGDIVEGGLRTTAASMKTELQQFQEIFKPLYDKGISVYVMRGNHENDVTDNLSAWNSIFSGTKSMPQNGPSGEMNLTYSFSYKNAFFVILDNYASIHRVNQSWLNQQLSTNVQPHVFVFGHEPAFKAFHSDCLDDYSNERNTFWKSLTDAGVKTYFCGHDHFFDVSQADDGDGNKNNDIYQCIVGGGGGWIMSKYNHNGVNSPYNVNGIYHENEHGYALVEISGENSNDSVVNIIWKKRTVAGTSVSYIPGNFILKYSSTLKR